jgi:hypothetical protein
VMMLAADFFNTRPVALIPSPSLLAFMAIEITSGAVRSLAIGVLLRSLNRRPQSLQR